MPPKKTGWQFFIDRGGTFTDIVARGPDGLVLTHKLLSDSPRHYADAAAYGIRWLLARHGAADDRVDAVRMGTTLATNALLERRGARTGLVITRGFRDALRIGYQNRPHLFRRRIELPGPLYAHVVEVDERIDADGAVLRPLDVGQLRAALSTLRERGIESVAIVFMHGYRYPTHERAAAALAREAGFAEVCASHAVSPLIRLVSRGDTTVADAYLTPLLKRYVAQFSAELGAGLLPARLSFMQSNGGLAEAAAFRGANAVLSGPAGGVVGMVRAGEALGRGRLIGFDMGGTSTDVALYDGEYPRRFDTTIAGVRLQAPMMNIHTVAAGGGSVLRFASGRLQVGPDSAGAHPGPACYRNGGPLTVTDANVLLGRVRAAHFPRVFGPAGSDPLDADVVGQRFAAMAAEVGAATGRTMAPEALAAGFLEVAVDAMANAIRHVSVRQGRDAAGYTLVCFGGAGGQHACRVAAALGMREILIHPLAGVLSAWGIGLADQRVLRRASLERPFARETLDGVLAALAALSRESVSELEGQGTPPAAIRVDARVELRASGTEMSLPVAAGSFDAMLAEFLATFQRRFGFAAVPTQVTVAAVRAEAVAPGGYAGSTTVRAAPADPEPAMPASGGTGAARETEGAARVRAWFDGWQEVALFRRDRVTAGTTIVGPAILAEDTTTTVVEPGWEARALDAGELLLVRTGADGRPRDGDTALDPVRLEVFNHRFMHIAEQMGAVLEATAVSVNIRERLDFSCAVFDPTGALIANAPHMPVHLGSMGASVRAVLEARGGRMRPGDAWLINDPYTGGTHLPDVTLVTPVFLGCGPRPEFFVASRAHHADIGGTTPGSMPPMSHTIEEEGVLFDGFQLLEAGVLREDALRAVLASGPWPARNPQQSIADLKAQVAANARGAEELARLVAEQGAATVRAYMRYVQDNAEAAVREVIDRLRDGSFRCELDSGRAVAVSVRVDHAARRAVIDFTGTSPQTDDNFNAPRAVCTAAVLYVFRTLVDSDIPLNEGCLRPLEIIIPEGTMLSPRAPAAVVAGNVETSQCIVDALYGALGCLAASQGTMNNLTFGNERYQYYETIAGGAGAGPGFDGASGVQTHMTNSRLTDPEVLESRYPVLLREFSIRAGSGGAGRHRGGDGLVRRIEFREPMTAAILSNRRRIAPFGLDGGSDASTGVNRVLRADGRVQELPATAEVTVEPGDQLEILTPGGGGFGAP